MTRDTSSTRSFFREPARRVFASELREARLSFRDGDDEKSPTFVMLPTGIRCNRIFVCGEMTQKDRKGDQNIFYTARVQDPTGIFFINAGSYQPEAMQQIARIEPPAFVAVVGKPGIRETPDGAIFVSVRAETVTLIDRDTYRCWVDDVAGQTLQRIEAFGTTDDSAKAKEFYSTNPSVYFKMVSDALRMIEF